MKPTRHSKNLMVREAESKEDIFYDIRFIESKVSQIETAFSVLSRFAGAPKLEAAQEMIPVLKDRLGLDQISKEVIGLESNIDLKGVEYLSQIYDTIVNEHVLTVEYQDFKSDKPSCVCLEIRTPSQFLNDYT